MGRLAARWRVFGVAAWALAVVGLASPAVFLRPDVGLDSSWQVALQMATLRGLQWGTQVVWTYGPYGYLDQPIYAYFRTWIAAALAGIVLHLVLCTALGLFLWHGRIGTVGWLLSAAIFILPLDLTLEYQSLLTAMLLLYLGLEVDQQWAAHLLAAAAGAVLALLGLVKGTGLLSAAILAAVFVVLSLVRHREGRVVTLIMASAFVFTALWIIAGQSLTGIPAYLRTSYELSSGYSAAMSYTAGTPEPLGHGIPGALVIGVTTLATIVAVLRRELTMVSIGWLSLTLILVGFKEGFVRGDIIHQLRFYSEATLLLGPVLLLALRRRAWWESLMSAAAVIITIGALLLGVRLEPQGLPPAWQAQTVTDRLGTYSEAAMLVAEPKERQKQSTAAAAQMRATYQLSTAIVSKLREGTVDVVPFDLDIVYAYGLNWVPRPVLQTYQAYTPALDRLDRDHFSGSYAPDRVLFILAAIDERYPLFEEPEATWMLLHRYQVEEVEGPYVVLVRGAPSLPGSGHTPAKVTAQLGSAVSVPQEGADVRASIQVSYSFRGQLRSLVYRPSGLHVQFLYGNGQRSPEYRLIPGTALDGVPLGWYVPDTGALVEYVQGHPTHRIRGIVVSADNPADYGHVYQVSFEVTS